MLTFLAETQEAGIVASLVIAVGMALLARLLYKPRDEQVLKDTKPNTATQRGAFIPLVIGTRQVGAIVGFVGNRFTTQEEVEGGGKGFLGGDSPEQTIYWEDAIHYLCVGPANRIHGIYIDGKLIPGSTTLNSLTHPSGTAITFPGEGTIRIYWGTLTHLSTTSLLAEELGIDTQGPYVCRVEWVSRRLGTSAAWTVIEYVVECDCLPLNAEADEFSIGLGVNPAYLLWQLLTAAYPHGGGMPSDWIDFAAISNVSDVAIAEEIGMNLLVQNGDPLDRIIGEIMQDFGLLLPECNGVLSPYPVREITDAVPVLDNDLLLPPLESIEKVHTSPLGDALIYEYDDRDANYRTGTIDVDDDTIGAQRNQRKTKKIKFTTITERDVASRTAARRQIEDLEDAMSVKAKGQRGLRAVVPGQAFDLPGIGRVRCLGYKLHWNDPTVELDLLRDPFNQAIIPFTDPALPGGIPTGDLEQDIRFDVFELPYLAAPGINVLVALRHRDNQSIFHAHIWTSPDDVTYTAVGNQNVACAGGVLESDWEPSHYMPIVEEGPLVTIDGNGDETVPKNLSSLPNNWIAGAQFMVIGSGQDAELFYVREWVEIVPDTTWQPLGLVRGRIGTGLRSPWLFGDKGMYRAHAEGSACYIILRSQLRPLTGGDITYGAVQYAKTQPENQQGALPIAAVLPDEIVQTSRGTTQAPLAWYTCGGSFAALPGQGRRDREYSPKQIDSVIGADEYEDIVFEFLPVAPTGGAGTQGMGQPTEIDAIEGNLIVEVYYAILGSPDTWVHYATHTIAMSALLGADGVHRWIYTRTQMDIDWVPIFNQPVWLWELSDLIDDDHNAAWKFLLYHDNGTLSTPVELRPHALTQTEAYHRIPGAQA